jgi:type I restriction enzyme M protein
MIRPQETHVALWGVVDALRGVMEAQILSECVLALFFLKYVSDVTRDQSWAGERRFVLPDTASFHSLLEDRHDPGNADRIDAALSELERSNPEKLAGLFGHVRFGSPGARDLRAQDEALARALRILSSDKVDLRPSRMSERDVIGAFTFLLSGLALHSHSSAGALYTPRAVTNIMAQLMDPHAGDSMYDPVCGSGSLLLTCAGLIRDRHDSREYRLSGQDINRTACMLARMNMMLHGEDKHCIAMGDTLRKPALLDSEGGLQRYDVVVANPPFSVADWDWEAAAEDRFRRFKHGVPPRGRADYAFILHAVASMKTDTGRAAVVVPHGVLFRGGSEGAIRRSLIKNNLVDTVIGLPPKLFYNTAIPAAIVCFRAKRANDNVLFIDASRDFAQGRRLNELGGEAIERIIAACTQRGDVEGYARVVTAQQIAANDFNLNISLYLSPARQETRTDPDALNRRQRELESDLLAIRSEIESRLQELGRQLGSTDNAHH